MHTSCQQNFTNMNGDSVCLRCVWYVCIRPHSAPLLSLHCCCHERIYNLAFIWFLKPDFRIDRSDIARQTCSFPYQSKQNDSSPQSESKEQSEIIFRAWSRREESSGYQKNSKKKTKRKMMYMARFTCQSCDRINHTTLVNPVSESSTQHTIDGQVLQLLEKLTIYPFHHHFDSELQHLQQQPKQHPHM